MRRFAKDFLNVALAKKSFSHPWFNASSFSLIDFSQITISEKLTGWGAAAATSSSICWVKAGLLLGSIQKLGFPESSLEIQIAVFN